MLSVVAIVILALALVACKILAIGEARFTETNQGKTSRSSLFTLAMPLIYVPLLTITARLGARTFPGIWTPNNPLLNDITQGGVFYIAAATAIVCGVIDIFLWIENGSIDKIFRVFIVWVKRLLLVAAVSVCLYGILVAISLERLP